MVFLFVVEECWEHVLNGFAFWVAHRVDGGIGAFGEQLVCKMVSLAVAADDTVNFPKLQVIEELTAGDSYLAYEQLIDVVGVYQFFSLSPFCFVSFAFLPGSGAYHAVLSSITLFDASTNSVGVALVRMSVIVTGASASG